MYVKSANRMLAKTFKLTSSPFQSSISYQTSLRDTIRTLSTTTTVPGGDVSGFLYTPTLPANSGCDVVDQYVPENATRSENLPHTMSIGFIAIAPWISPTCTMAFLNAAKNDPVRGMLFYRPDNSSDSPPDESSAIWSLGDGGKWKSAFKFPVYVIPGKNGAEILAQTVFYRGNLTDVPHGHEIANQFPADWYVRLAASVDIGTYYCIPPSLKELTLESQRTRAIFPHFGSSFSLSWPF
jgi:hypothetical protein